MNSRVLLISTLAEYQTAFWLLVGLELRQRGEAVEFLSFDDRSTEMLEGAGLRVHRGLDSAYVNARDMRVVNDYLAAFPMTRLNFWFGHERFAFGATDSDALRRKLAGALDATTRAIEDIGSRGQVTLVQELGGFLSVVGAYFAARRRNVDNWFIEPSFFRGRLFFLRNTFAAFRSSDPVPPVADPGVRSYLDETLRSGAIVVPMKDAHQYASATKKVVNFRNARRLAQKVADKYLRGKRQEFGHIGHHVRAHVSMLVNSRRLRASYVDLEDCERFVYYPLHVPGDMALTLRSPHLLDQLALIDYLCRSVPETHLLVVKEHPAMVGAFDSARLHQLLRRYDNLRLLRPSVNNFAVIRRADLVVSVNSKSGAEAGLVGCRTVVMGDAFYRDAPFAIPLERLEDLSVAIETALASREVAAGADSLDLSVRYFSKLWPHTVPGELYVCEPETVRRFTSSLLEATRA